MAAAGISLRYLVLGLLAKRPMSGYDIKRFLRGLSWLVATPSPGSLYPILHALLREGLVSVEVVPAVDKPARKIYSVTETGTRALAQWARQPAEAEAPLKSFVMRLLLAGSYPQAALAGHIEMRREQVARQRQVLEEMAEAAEGRADLGQHLALEYGLALATAELSWLDAALGHRSPAAQPVSGRVVESETKKEVKKTDYGKPTNRRIAGSTAQALSQEGAARPRLE